MPMSYLTIPEPVTYWLIVWSDDQFSLWPTKLWPVAMIDSLKTIAYYVKVNAAGIPIP